jgi:Cache domain
VISETREGADVAGVVTGVVERVFGTVDEVRRLTLACNAAATAHGRRLSDDDVRELAPELLARMRRPDEVAVGLGVILEPGLLGHPYLRLEWWQWVPGKDDPARLEVDLRPDSLDFYDYAATEWFAVPRRSRRRHVVGPYVDVHGTDRYLLTLTMPVEADGEFLGVAGADLPITRFEALVLGRLGTRAAGVVVNDDGRVVFSTSSRWVIGSLCRGEMPTASRRLPGLPWRVYDWS